MQLELFALLPVPAAAIPSVLSSLEKAALRLLAFDLSLTLADFQRRWYALYGAGDRLFAPVARNREAWKAVKGNPATPRKEKVRLGRLIAEADRQEDACRTFVNRAWGSAFRAFFIPRLAGLSDDAQSWLYELFSDGRACDAFGAHTLGELIQEARDEDALEAADAGDGQDFPAQDFQPTAD